MAFYILNIKHFPFPKFLSLFYLLMITNFFSVTSVRFNLSSFNYSESDISWERAFPENQEIKLTGNEKQVKTNLVGRATYSSPMHLWDMASGNLTDFTTHFSFVIDSQNNKNYADGLAFFLAPKGSRIPDNSSGGAMGLARGDQRENSTDNPFVAVEFDIYTNKQFDPPGVHLGIDINSLKSSANVSWEWANTSITQGLTNEARISYNSTSHNLSVLLTGWRNNTTTAEQSLSYIVDLRHYLPEWVTFGFSAATGSSPAMHNIRTWNFSSTLEDIVTNPAVDGSPSLNPVPNPRKNNRNRSHTEEDLALDSCMDEEFQRGTGPKRFSFKELAHATNNFNDEEKLESLLVWAMRYKVVQGLASALLYLHEEWEECVVHRDIKSSNIMLDSNFNAKLGDFGLARLVDHVKGSQTTILAGTMGYMAPEYITTGKARKESDVYSFGIVNLEIACGRKPIKPNASEDQIVLVEWVWELYGIGKVLEAADPRLGGDFDESQMERLMIVGLWCSHPNRNLRPSIREAIHVLNFEAPLPILPSNMPETAHLAPVVNRPASMSLSMSINIASDYGGR
ncbi:hypothetical protein FH972_025419 [Carpinus fangiana]|uniref:Protein kinase domain-containing protein n=1 Tax=Carpinus fangiana TaxID=176857 RepID=A0A5N6L0Z8_9ROSI|nr:hypothetical protein FH972_025419 [Carpinus fangiana]